MLLQGNFVKVFVKIKVLKLPEVKCMCTYGVTLPGEHLQVAWWWQRWCLHIRRSVLRGSLQPGSSASACINHRLCFSISSISVEEIHTNESTLEYACNRSCELFRIQNNYWDLRVCGASLRPCILNGGVCDLLIRCGDCLFKGTTDN